MTAQRRLRARRRKDQEGPGGGKCRLLRVKSSFQVTSEILLVTTEFVKNEMGVARAGRHGLNLLARLKVTLFRIKHFQGDWRFEVTTMQGGRQAQLHPVNAQQNEIVSAATRLSATGQLFGNVKTCKQRMSGSREHFLRSLRSKDPQTA